MNILIISPDYFDSISSLLINLITAGVSIASLLITLMMYKVAIKALTTWKDQKHYDIYLEAHLNLLKSDREILKILGQFNSVRNAGYSISDFLNEVDRIDDLGYEKLHEHKFYEFQEKITHLDNLNEYQKLKDHYKEINIIISNIRIRILDLEITMINNPEGEIINEKYESLKQLIKENYLQALKLSSNYFKKA